MALSGHSDEAWRLLVMPTAGGAPHVLFESAIATPLSVQAWALTGDALLFTQHNGQKMPLWWIPVQGGVPHETGLVREGLRGVRLQPDGNRIAFIAGIPSLEVWVMENFLEDF